MAHLIPWQGGKGRFLPFLKNLVPKDFGIHRLHYYEPFCGTAAFALYLSKHFDEQRYPNLKFSISDVNKDIVNMMTVTQQKPKALILALRKHRGMIDYMKLPVSERGPAKMAMKQAFYKMLELYNHHYDELTDVERASYFMQICNMTFIGKCAYNRKGHLVNTFGYRSNVTIPNERIMFISHALKRFDIQLRDYKTSIDSFNERAFSFFDPPYMDDAASTSIKIDYNKQDFTFEDHVQLASKINDMLHNGDHRVIVANAQRNDDFYRDHFPTLHQYIIQVQRTLAQESMIREEVFITNCHHSEQLKTNTRYVAAKLSNGSTIS